MDITCSKSDFPPLFCLFFSLLISAKGVTYGADYLISAFITAIYTNTLALCFASTMADMVFAFQMRV